MSGLGTAASERVYVGVERPTRVDSGCLRTDPNVRKLATSECRDLAHDRDWRSFVGRLSVTGSSREFTMTKTPTPQSPARVPWNRGRIIGPKPPLKPRHIWAIRTRLQHDGHVRDIALFNVAIDSKLRGCDLVKLRVADVHLGEDVRLRITIVQQKTGRPVPFEMTEPTRDALTV